MIVQQTVLSFLYSPDEINSDILAFGLCASALQLIIQRWRQVDTPSVESAQSPVEELSDFEW